MINQFVSDGRSKRQYYQIQINCALTLTIQWQIAQSNENLIQIQLIRFIPISSINQSVIKTNRSPVNICHISSKLSWLIRNKIRHGRKQKLVSFMDSFSRSNTLNSSGLSFNKWWFKLDSIICFFEHQDDSIQTQFVSDKWAVELNCFGFKFCWKIYLNWIQNHRVNLNLFVIWVDLHISDCKNPTCCRQAVKDFQLIFRP